MRRTAEDLGMLVGAFVAATLLAELVGAVNLGTSLTFGMLAFTAVLMVILLRR
ncbi:MAG TPA: hypothetical protein VGW11_09370 [Solirubrobacteraceae bacterium]|nr:hypothetical protein [Solirubrobacteraceae bacterium]